MPVCSLCQKFFRDALAPFHQYRHRAILDATAALSRGASTACWVMRLYTAISPLFFITLPGFSPSSLMPDSRPHGSVMSVHWAGILLAEYGETSSSGWPVFLNDG
jgi:hypothetical protein